MLRNTKRHVGERNPESVGCSACVDAYTVARDGTDEYEELVASAIGTSAAVSIVRVGVNENARRFLKLLDDALVHASFDICDTSSVIEVEEFGLEVLLGVIDERQR